MPLESTNERQPAVITPTTELTVIVHNWHEGAWGIGADPDADRLPDIIDQYLPYRPDIVIATEVRDQRPYRRRQARPGDHVQGYEADRERLAAFGDPLGLTLAGLTPSRSGVPAAVLYRPDRLRWRDWHDGASADHFTNGCATAVFDIDGLPVPLAVSVLHADPWAWTATLAETLRAVALTDAHYAYALIGGDFNAAPDYGGPIPPGEALAGHHRMNRLVAGPEGSEPNLAAARALARAGYADAAALVDACARREGERYADWFERVRTANLGRSDRAYLSDRLAPAVCGYERLATHPGGDGRYPVLITLDLARLAPTGEPDRR